MKKERSVRRSREWWAKQVERCKGSGMTMAAYAAKNDINRDTFYKWAAALGAKSKLPGEKKPSRRGKNKTKGDKLPFVEVSIGKKNSSMIELTSPSGWHVRMSMGIDGRELAKVVEILERI